MAITTPSCERSVDPLEAESLRGALVEGLVARGAIRDPRIVEAMLRVERHRFVPSASLRTAYLDAPVSIGHGQTISQPTVVGMMTEALDLSGDERVLEIGTGSGYQAAVLAELVAEVQTIEIVASLGETARERLRALGYSNVTVHVGDGYRGLPESAPFDRVILTAAPPEIPRALLDQLAEDGVLVAPVGPEGGAQQLVRIRKRQGHLEQEDLGTVYFVPMVESSSRPSCESPW
jgi:protein-L-isoaspartate(D-aspartate) O-methyltransferase